MIISTKTYWVLLIKMWPVWARLIVAPPARGHLEVTLSVFLDSGGSWSFFVQEIYIKTNVRLSKNTYVFEPSFSDIYFTGRFDFSFIFSVFFWFNRVYLWYLVLFLLFYFSIKYSMVKWIYVGWFHTCAGFLLAYFQQTVVTPAERHVHQLLSKANEKPALVWSQPTCIHLTMEYLIEK